MKVTFLVDNYVDRASLIAEHGFSALVEIFGKKILFDAGQTDAVLKNIANLSIDFQSIDYIVLSHGHYDHTGGLKYLSLNDKVKIYSHIEIGADHFRVSPNNGYDYIGIDKDFYNRHMENFIFNDKMLEIEKGVLLSGQIERFEEFDSDKNLFLIVDGKPQKDYFPDEQYLVICENDGYKIITGCSHAGIVNIIHDFRRKFKDARLKSVIGGFHLFRSGEKELRHVSDFLIKNDIRYIITGHCTGIDAISFLKNKLGKRLIPIKVGLTIEI